MKNISFAMAKFPEGHLRDLGAITNLEENIDYGCDFVVARDENYNILGVAGVNLHRHQYPRFEHIIIHPSKQKSSLAIELMNYMEAFLNRMGKKQYISFILHEKKLMQKYAVKWGMKEYSSNERGKWYYKDLNSVPIWTEEKQYEYA